jgi:UrcA family protein
MNTASKSTLNTRILAISIFMALASSASTVCSAADPSDAPQTTVKYGDLNVSSTQGATTLYSRIQGAAENVCRPLDGRDFASQHRYAFCLRNAIADAVKNVDQPALFAVFSAKTGTSKPIFLASSQSR